MATGKSPVTEERLPADLQAVMNELDRTDREARELVESLSSAQLNWQPNDEGAWSVGQCLDHMAQVNILYTSALRAAVRGAHSLAGTARKPIQPGWFGRLVIRSMEPPPRVRVKAQKVIPPAQQNGAEVLRAFLAAHDDVRALIRESQTLDLNRVRFRNPFVRLFHFTVGTGLLIIGVHDRRHFWQARQVCAAMKAGQT